MNDSIVLVGSGQDYRGTGLLISYQGKKYVLTVGHVTRIVQNDVIERNNKDERNIIWAIPDVKMTKNPPGGYPVILINKDIYCDQNDLSICEIVPTPEVEKHPFIPFDGMKFKDLKLGSLVKVLGYPSQYLKKMVTPDQPDPLPPIEINGTVIDLRDIDIPMEIRKEDGLPEKIYDAIIVSMDEKLLEDNGLSEDTGGFSGAIVVKDNEFIGIMIGGYSKKKCNAIFIHFVKVTKLLNGINDFIRDGKNLALPGVQN